MNREEIQHLANLSRIKLTDEELDQFEHELPKIIDYVSVISDIAADDGAEPSVGARSNVFRKDTITNKPDEFTAAILEEMPKTEGRFMSVKKILHVEE